MEFVSKVIQGLPDDAVIQGNLTRAQFENKLKNDEKGWIFKKII